jgi:hypothetical protein
MSRLAVMLKPIESGWAVILADGEALGAETPARRGREGRRSVRQSPSVRKVSP